jgi:hypothetical protein
MISCDACGCGDNRQGHGDSVSLDSQIVPITLSKRDVISCDACGCGDNRQGHGDSVSLDSQIVPITLSKRDEALFPRRDTCLTCSAWWCSPNAAVRLVWCSEWGSDL